MARTSLTSCRLAPSIARPSGTPCPAVRRLRFTPALPRSVGLGPVFFPRVVLSSLRHPYFTIANQCLATQRTARPQPARTSGTRPLRPIPESDHGRWTWHTNPSHSTPPIDRPFAGHTRSHPHSGDRAPMDGHQRNGGCLRGEAAVAPALPTGHPKSESRSSFCWLACARAGVLEMFQYVYPLVYQLFG